MPQTASRALGPLLTGEQGREKKKKKKKKKKKRERERVLERFHRQEFYVTH
jgi:hypothetical protein